MALIPSVVYDACVLYPFSLRNVLVQIAADRLVIARWNEEIHDEWIRNLLKNNPGVARSRLERIRDLMNSALPDALVTGYEKHIEDIMGHPTLVEVLHAWMRSPSQDKVIYPCVNRYVLTCVAEKCGKFPARTVPEFPETWEIGHSRTKRCPDVVAVTQ